MLRACPMPSPPPPTLPIRQLSLSQSAANIFPTLVCLVYIVNFLIHLQEAFVVQWLELRLAVQGCGGSNLPWSIFLLQLLNVGGKAGRPVQEKKVRPGGSVQNFLMLGGGGGGQEGTHWSFYTFITHKRLPLCQQFSASQDAYSFP